MAKNKISATAAAALFGGTPTNATRKPEEREQQPTEESKFPDIEKQLAECEHPDWVRWMQARMRGSDGEHLFDTPYYITYAEAARDYAKDHPKDEFAQQMAEQLQHEAEEKAKADRKQKGKGKKGRPKKTDGSIGAYFVVDPTQYEKMQQIANRHGLQMKQLVGKAFAMFIESYEAKHGEITTFDKGNIDNLI